MEGKKNDRPLWIRKLFDQFLEDFKVDRDPIVNLKAAISDLSAAEYTPISQIFHQCTAEGRNVDCKK